MYKTHNFPENAGAREQLGQCRRPKSMRQFGAGSISQRLPNTLFFGQWRPNGTADDRLGQ
jgi:hypothetical protein